VSALPEPEPETESPVSYFTDVDEVCTYRKRWVCTLWQIGLFVGTLLCGWAAVQQDRAVVDRQIEHEADPHITEQQVRDMIADPLEDIAEELVDIEQRVKDLKKMVAPEKSPGAGPLNGHRPNGAGSAPTGAGGRRQEE
jgi:hypothetical protein